MSPHANPLARCHWLPLLAVLNLCAQPGCILFPAVDYAITKTSGRSLLPPIQASPDAVQLDVCFLERPAEDPLLVSEVWKEVDQIGALSSETRDTLHANGFRVGMVSSNPPPAVQKLLGMVAEIPTDLADSSGPFRGFHTFIAPGVESQVATGIEQYQSEFVIHDPDRTKTVEFDRASGVLRMKAHRMPDGWVRVDFQPEIHHGESRLRVTPTEKEWTHRGGQQIDVLYPQRFNVMMNVGESVMITSTSDDDSSLGDRFFCRQDQGTKKQRVLVIRVADSGRASVR